MDYIKLKEKEDHIEAKYVDKTFYDKVKKLCEDRGTTITAFERGVGLSKGSAVKWKKSAPNSSTLVKIANFFNISVELLTEKEIEATPLDAKAILDQLIFSLGADAPVNFSVDEMPEDERAILQQGLQAALDKHKLYKELKENWQNENQ